MHPQTKHLREDVVSIALATFNGANYIKEQLDSFASQIRIPDELVICDDGSTDDTIDIVLEFRNSAPFAVRLIQNEQNLGHVQNFSKAISHCIGDIIFLSDQDDKWFPEKIENVVTAMQETPKCWVAVHDGEIADEELTPSGQTKMLQLRRGYGSADTISTGALSALRRGLLEYALPIPAGSTAHDTWLHQLASQLPGRRIVLEESLQYIRRHNTNTSSWIVNNKKPIRSYDVIRAQSRQAPAADYTDRLILNAGLRGRLSTMIERLDDPADVRAAQYAKIRLANELKAIQSRQTLISAGPVGRRIHAIRMLFWGEYSFFNGARSFVRDILR